MDTTAFLSKFASSTKLSDISSEAVAATKRHILDCTGVALAAAAEPAGRILIDVMREQGGAAQAGVLGSGLRTNTISAAWANGALAHLLDYDDTGFSHPTACIQPAALAMAEATAAAGGVLVAA
ncbi:MAG: MmgE/PrpD family protein, partial [Enhydrobacter sp.]